MRAWRRSSKRNSPLEGQRGNVGEYARAVDTIRNRLQQQRNDENHPDVTTTMGEDDATLARRLQAIEYGFDLLELTESPTSVVSAGTDIDALSPALPFASAPFSTDSALDPSSTRASPDTTTNCFVTGSIKQDGRPSDNTAALCSIPQEDAPTMESRMHNIVAKGTLSQYSAGGPSACTSICIYAASHMLSNANNESTSMTMNASTLDSVVQMGVWLHESASAGGQHHSGVDDLWSKGVFSDVVRHLKRGTTSTRAVSLQAFWDMLEEGRRFALQESHSSSVAIVLTRPPETVLCFCPDVSFKEDCCWLLFDSHGLPSAEEKVAYLEQFVSGDHLAMALCDKYPFHHVDASLQSQQINMFEATPIVFTRESTGCARASTIAPTAQDTKPAAVTLGRDTKPSATTPPTHESTRTNPFFNAERFRDPTNMQLIADPVVCDRGHTHERTAIEAHFRARREMASEQEAERRNGDGGPTCRRNVSYELTCPFTNEPISEVLIPNLDMERIIVQLVESRLLELTAEEQSEWEAMRAEKRVRDEERRQQEAEAVTVERDEEDTDGSSQPELEPQPPPQLGVRPTRELVEVVHPIETMTSSVAIVGGSRVDLGISTVLPEPSDIFASRHSPRCGVASCRQVLEPPVLRCARCLRNCCSSCLAFQVSKIGQNQGVVRATPAELHEICGECVLNIADVLQAAANDDQIRTREVIANVLLPDFFQSHVNRLCQLEQQMVRHRWSEKFGEQVATIRRDIERLRGQKDELEEQTRRARTEADRARRDVFSPEDRGIGSKDIGYAKRSSQRSTELEKRVQDLEDEYNTLLGAGPSGEEDDRYALNISRLMSQIEEARIELAVERDNAESEHLVSDSRVADLQASYDRLLAQILQMQSNGPPADEDDQFAYVSELSSLTTEFDEVQNSLQRAQQAANRPGGDVASSSTASPSTRIEGQSYSFSAPFLRFARHVFGTGPRESLCTAVEAANTPDTDVPNVNIDSIRDDLDAVRRPSNSEEVQLPLGLSYPTERMQRRLETMLNTLEQRRLVLDRQEDNHYARLVAELDSTREGLEDAVSRASRAAEDAESSAAEERRRMEARAERRREAEEAARQREQRRIEEQRAAEEQRQRLEEEERASNQYARQADLRQCGNPKCGFGPIMKPPNECNQMDTHNDRISVLVNGKRVRRRRNACPRCGWFHSDWNLWPKYRR